MIMLLIGFYRMLIDSSYVLFAHEAALDQSLYRTIPTGILVRANGRNRHLYNPHRVVNRSIHVFSDMATPTDLRHPGYTVSTGPPS